MSGNFAAEGGYPKKRCFVEQGGGRFGVLVGRFSNGVDGLKVYYASSVVAEIDTPEAEKRFEQAAAGINLSDVEVTEQQADAEFDQRLESATYAEHRRSALDR